VAASGGGGQQQKRLQEQQLAGVVAVSKGVSQRELPPQPTNLPTHHHTTRHTGTWCMS
jgi:hypothetical protein